FTPKRLNRVFEKGRSFATVEGGKWIGSARAGFDGLVVGHNENLIAKPELLTQDSFDTGWMLVVRPARDDWREGLVTGLAVGPAMERWIESGSYKDRSSQ
ncbi:MAG: hypothetical protein ACHQAQ_20800, partial [Hyphomicrobiales bacterium]